MYQDFGVTVETSSIALLLDSSCEILTGVTSS